MNPKEKAEQLVETFSQVEVPEFDNGKIEQSHIGYYAGKEVALMAVKMIVKELNGIPKYATCGKFEYKKGFWNEVKTEIENLK